MELIGIILSTIFIVEFIFLLIDWYGDTIKKIIYEDKKTNKAEDKVKELSKTFEIERSLNEVLNNQRVEINRLKQQILNNSEQDKHMKNNDKQIVYKIEKGDLVGNINGDNIIVILMNGDMVGDITSENGDVVLIKGDITGDVKANKVICPQQKSEYENYIDKLSNVEKLSKPDKDNKPDKEKMFRRLPPDLPPDYIRCADCVYAKDYFSNKYKCSKYDGLVLKDSVRICDSFKQKEHHTCKSCYHFVKGAKRNDYYCSKHGLDKIPNSDSYCQYYDGTGATSYHQIDCARASNNSGLCLFFCTSGCPIKNGCPYKIDRSEDVKL